MIVGSDNFKATRCRAWPVLRRTSLVKLMAALVVILNRAEGVAVTNARDLDRHGTKSVDSGFCNGGSISGYCGFTICFTEKLLYHFKQEEPP